MRLWSLHPEYLDARGLVAVWREGLLARKILAGKTRGYRNHSQLKRFKAAPDPVLAVDAYLSAVLDEARRRGYNFDASKIEKRPMNCRIAVTRGQIAYEMEHLKKKLEKRDKTALRRQESAGLPKPHPLFEVVEGGIEDWEVVR